jgi:hypothetical protein
VLAGIEEQLSIGEKMTAIRALMTCLVDYAGLFPPASLEMGTAVRRYREYLAGDDAWALGRFVVPASRLKEFSAVFNEVCCGEREPVWGLNVLLSDDLAGDAVAIEKLTQGAVSLDAVEAKAAGTADAERILQDFAPGLDVYVEFEPRRAREMLPVLQRFGVRAKMRTGGVTAEAFPAVETVAEFMAACARERVPLKATAGLHHAVRGEHRLTYGAESARATMHGFVNVFLAAVLAWRGEDARRLMATLKEEDASAFAFGKESVRWLGFEAGVDEIERVRRQFAVSYGSCSFTEPLEEVKAHGWL